MYQSLYEYIIIILVKAQQTKKLLDKESANAADRERKVLIYNNIRKARYAMISIKLAKLSITHSLISLILSCILTIKLHSYVFIFVFSVFMSVGIFNIFTSAALFKSVELGIYRLGMPLSGAGEITDVAREARRHNKMKGLYQIKFMSKELENFIISYGEKPVSNKIFIAMNVILALVYGGTILAGIL